MRQKQKLPGFFYITGCDGTGKTTQARLLAAHLQQLGQRVHHVWLRFPFFLSAPILFYARLRKLSWYEQHDGKKYGYWDFSKSYVMKRVFPWVLLADAFFAGICMIHIPRLFGWCIVCERFSLDMLVDLCVGCHEIDFWAGLPGRLFFHLLPNDSGLIVLDLKQGVILKRRPDLVYDHILGEKLALFRKIANLKGFSLLSTESSIESVNNQVIKMVLR